MQIVIDIPEEDWEFIKESDGCRWSRAIIEGVINGTPLPKDHGDLIDKDRLLDELEKTVKSVDDTNKHLLFWDRAVAHVHLSKPIIEAESEEEEWQKKRLK